MESKKINQLATELAPELSDLTIIGDPTTGISKKITLSQMASLFTGTVEEYASLSAFPLVGAADTIYIALDTNIIYRWNTGTSAYVELSPNIVTSLVFNDANGFDGTISLVGSTATLTITTALTTGSVGFIGASGALTQDNANFFWDDTNNRLGIGTNAPTTALDVFGSGIIGRINGTSTNNAFLGFASAGTNKWSIGNVQSDHRFRIYSEANTSELVSVLQTGEFGIGIANPTTKLHIDGGASALIANLDANVSVAKSISFRSDNSARINLEVSGTESGSNAGADLFIRRYSDAGSLINTALYLQRSSGNFGIGGTTITDSNLLNLIGDSASVNIGIVLNNTNSTNAKIYGIQNVSKNLVFYDYSSSAARLTIGSTGTINFFSDVQLPVGNFVQWLSYSDANSRSWGIRTNQTAVGDFAILSSSTNNDTLNTVRLSIRNNGNLGIGTNNPSGQLDIYATGTDLATYFTQASAGNNNFTRWTRTSGPTLITGVVRNSNDGNQKANTAFIGTTNSFDFLFYTNDSERGRFTSDGWFKASNTGTYISGTFHEFSSSLNNATTFRIKATSSTFTDYIAFIHADKANNSDYSFLQARSSNTSDTEFNLRGDGNAYADGSWNGGGADYAEYFEWLDGNPNNEDRRGYSVSLVGNKIKIAQKGETIIGVISGNPSVIGDSAWNMWTEKYLRDDFGTYVRDEEGFRILNPNYNPDIDYISREERPEWGIVGLMGKLCIRKGQEVMPNWIKMQDISDNVEQWLIK